MGSSLRTGTLPDFAQLLLHQAEVLAVHPGVCRVEVRLHPDCTLVAGGEPTEYFYCYPLLAGEIWVWTGYLLSSNEQCVLEHTLDLLGHYGQLHQSYQQQQQIVELLEQTVQQVGHQLRNRLGLCALYAENLYQGLPEGGYRSQAELVRELVQNLDHQLTDLLHCGQHNTPPSTRHNLREILRVSCTELAPLLEAKQISVVYPEQPVWMICDEFQLKQVFINLLSNAAYFSPVAGTITVQWTVYQQEIVLQIKDQGPGLSVEDLASLATPFYSRRPGGTGLGLAIVKKILLAHRGVLWASNLPQGGAQFSFTLNLTPGV